MSNAPHFDIDVPAFWADPYPALAKMRKQAPIAFVPQLGSTVFTRRDDIFTQEKRIDVFSSHQPVFPPPTAWADEPADGPQQDAQGWRSAHVGTRGDVSRGVAAPGARHLDAAVPGPCRPYPRRPCTLGRRPSLQGLCAPAVG